MTIARTDLGDSEQAPMCSALDDALAEFLRTDPAALAGLATRNVTLVMAVRGALMLLACGCTADDVREVFQEALGLAQGIHRAGQS